jgi:hypothetical protein
MLLKLLLAAPAVLPIFSTLAYNMTITGTEFPTSNCDALNPAVTFGGNSKGSRFCFMNLENDDWLVEGVSFSTEYEGVSAGNFGGNITALTVYYRNKNSTTIGLHEKYQSYVGWNSTEDYMYMASGYPPADVGGLIWYTNVVTTNATSAFGGTGARGGSYPSDPAKGVLLGVSGYSGAWGIESLTFYTRPALCEHRTYGSGPRQWDGRDCRTGQSLVTADSGAE